MPPKKLNNSGEANATTSSESIGGRRPPVSSVESKCYPDSNLPAADGITQLQVKLENIRDENERSIGMLAQARDSFTALQKLGATRIQQQPNSSTDGTQGGEHAQLEEVIAENQRLIWALDRANNSLEYLHTQLEMFAQLQQNSTTDRIQGGEESGVATAQERMQDLTLNGEQFIELKNRSPNQVEWKHASLGRICKECSLESKSQYPENT